MRASLFRFSARAARDAAAGTATDGLGGRFALGADRGRLEAEHGFTLVELLIVIAIIGILVVMATAGYRYARVRSDESSAVSTLDAINKAQFSFQQICGNQRYAPTLVSLGVPVPGSGAAFLSPDLTVSDPLMKSGYVFQMTGTELIDVPPACNGAAPISAYMLTADPQIPGMSGSRYFGTNGDGVIYEDAGTFIGNMPETGVPAHGHEIR